MFDEWQLYIFWGCFFVVVILILKFIRACARRGSQRMWADRVLQRAKRAAFFTWFIRFFLITYLKVWITFGRQVEMSIADSKYQHGGEAMIGYSMLLVIVLFPALVVWILSRSRLFLAHRNIKQQIGNLTHKLHLYKESSSIHYFPMFLLRRAIFVAIPTFIGFPFWQT